MSNGSTVGLGDVIARALAAVGLTEGRVSGWLGVEECGCRGRRDRLNAVTFWARRILSGKTERAKEYLDALIGEDDP